LDAVVAGDECRGGSVWVTSDRLVIKYDAARSRRNQVQQVFHEVAHVLCDHRGDGTYVVSPSVLTDGIDPGAIQYVLHRGAFDTETEAQAEIVGTRLAVLCRGAVTDARGQLHRSATLMEPLRR